MTLWPSPDTESFASRHNGPREGEIAAMLEALGVGSLEELIAETVPAAILDRKDSGIGPGLSETEALARLREMARGNVVMRSMIGQGYHDTILPPVIQRNILENPAWYTAYTPYQPEISQGRLEALLNFQTLVRDLTGMDIANASLLDEATACAEAMALAQRVAKSKATAFFVDEDTHPQTLAVLRTRAEPLGWEIVTGDPARDLDASAVFGALFSYPGSSGAVRDFRAEIGKLHAAGAIAAMTCDPLALVLLEAPGALGADIAVGSMQRFGVPMGFGGPHAGYMATKDAHKRHMPGRIVGVSRDSRGRAAYRLALQTREQHIRREKATSNICTAQVLLAVIASMYAVWHGPEGLRAIARRAHRYATILADGLRALGVKVETAAFFDTITVAAAESAPIVLERARAAGINLRDAGGGRIGIACDETTTQAEIRALWRCFCPDEARLAALEDRLAAREALPEGLLRRDALLEMYPVFHAHRSETDLLRYMRRLSDCDLALDRTMIPLGSCTMKLNATAEMIPITWPEFAAIHPFAPADQTRGYAELFAWLERALCAVSGYDAVSLQPNSGAQGEYAGLLAIRAWHRARGDVERDVCLIPASAHGTNPASAQMAGMRVVVVGCDAEGNVDLGDLDAKLAQHEGRVAAIMVTYPSTHGVFEEGIAELCRKVHDAGGQVYLDGANMNAQVGLARPGHYGADVSHFNLHKTFCIPHGGGGPGMGPIGVKAHLAPYLPGRPERGDAHAVSAAPFGSASILPISVAYIMMMGDAGLRRATEVAILNANYVAHRLGGHYPVLYRGAKGRTAHECIVDLRPLKESAGVTVDDVAKRLIDHGFHAPTVSFPVAGTFMIEPTESENKAELDRFCDAMIAIRHEVAAVEVGEIGIEASPLRHAPHTAADLAGEWDRAYGRAAGCFPAGETAAKYWPPVNRIDNAWGDRNLVCACPEVSSYAEAAE
ncbi:aminomethyl-transferring glycine dehydrogenase [Acidomonas methanolica]|uniref:Glycine dehydrogenase (decarboxylating) n=1 Tax=Acidomonas methanolica NBRC 104435 TaxID=1231351 RepID=A0A023D2K7_ACIMT|nr:aminomethyl-transferring glycine dehydrogenase [Acidomonas methanolica]MBU2654184.1 aminomethyl-transferring glycine dehydrogenase [Acidomonas methanolica]TCS30586.1 glycine dehydrogenase [Acidomonas methanolica]GAJ28372.1 glycine dehydrogenase [Acidomonas methanolica NBRC 104435]GBQ46322.1 glycine dehydrogenase [Acidomonas methanolica]GEK98856.1 glycine dehydrogenase (decarboxylating) [Acidomonas methanolica NBRC 104435]